MKEDLAKKMSGGASPALCCRLRRVAKNDLTESTQIHGPVREDRRATASADRALMVTFPVGSVNVCV